VSIATRTVIDSESVSLAPLIVISASSRMIVVFFPIPLSRAATCHFGGNFEPIGITAVIQNCRGDGAVHFPPTPVAFIWSMRHAPFKRKGSRNHVVP
jgi:hypothetical protein